MKGFHPRHDFILCIDSDGTAMDTMEIKHRRCFGPAMIEVFSLHGHTEERLARWNEINLYSPTRGINRFKGLALALTEIQEGGTNIAGLDEIRRFAAEAPELSNNALELAVAAQPEAEGLRKALIWSYKVNESIRALKDEDKKAFAGVRECLEQASDFADLILLSSANREAVEEEWAREGLLDYVSAVYAQDSGSKAQGIRELLNLGCARDHLLLLGDAPADLEAAEQNGVFFYPILVRREVESWKELREHYLDLFRLNKYASCAVSLKERFRSHLRPQE